MRRFWAREQNLSRRVFAILLSWVRAVLFVSCVLWPLGSRWAVTEGQTLARVVAMSVAVSWIGAGVADGDPDELDASHVSSEGAEEGVVLRGLLGDLIFAAEIPA